MAQSTHPTIRRLSPSQLHALHMGKHYKLRRSSMGWWPYNHPRQGVSKVVRIIRPATIKSLWKMGLLDGNYDRPTGIGSQGLELWTNEDGRRLLNEITHDTGIIFDPGTDELVYFSDLGLNYVFESAAVH